MKTENNKADFTIIAERPTTAANVWISSAQQVPNIVLKPSVLPSVRVFLVAIAVSGPGKIMRKIHIIKNK